MTAPRIVYFGTPAYAVPCLERLASDDRFEVALVVTQPDRPAGRGRRLTAPPVKDRAVALGLQVYQPESLRAPEARRPLEEANADLFVVAAFGLIFGPKTLAIPRHGTLNLHASLLPRFRGASPVTAAILEGDRETGVSLMVMERGLDTGPVVGEVRLPIGADDTTESLTARLAHAGAGLALERIPDFIAGRNAPVPQDDALATFCRPLIKADGEVDWRETAERIERQVRAMWPWPRASAIGEQGPFQIHSASVVDAGEWEAGVVEVIDGWPVVGCGADALRLDRVQFPGGAPMPGQAAVAGKRLRSGERLSTVAEPRPPLVMRVFSGESATTA